MKTAFLAVFISFLFSFSAPEKSTSGSFTMRMENSKDKQVTTSECYLKGANMLAITTMSNNPGKKIKVIVNADDHAMYMIDDDKKTAMKMPFDQMASAVQANTDEPKVTFTDEYQTINGYKCRKVLSDSKTGTSENWITNDVDIDFSSVSKAFASLSRGSGRPANEYADFKGFPIKCIITGKQDGHVSTITYTNIKAGSVDASLFDVSGYKIQDISSQMGGKGR